MNVEDFTLNTKDNFVEIDFQHAHQFKKKCIIKVVSHLRTNLRERESAREVHPSGLAVLTNFFPEYLNV